MLCPQMSGMGVRREPFPKGKAGTVDHHVLTSLVQRLLLKQTQFTSFTKRVTLMIRSSIMNLLPLLGLTFVTAAKSFIRQARSSV